MPSRITAIAVACLLLFNLSAQAAGSITVAVAANVKPAFNDIATSFKAATGIEAIGVFGSSGKIAAQVKQGAPYDVFLSADTEFAQALQKEGLTANAPRVYAHGTLVLWTTADFDLGRGVNVLTDEAIKKIAIPNPELAPYGREAVRALEHEHLQDAVKTKLVYGENIAQATQFVLTKAADIGFTAKSMVLSPELKSKGKWIEVPSAAYRPIAQAAVVLKHGSETNAAAASAFFDFLFSNQARAIFTQYGYLPP